MFKNLLVSTIFIPAIAVSVFASNKDSDSSELDKNIANVQISGNSEHSFQIIPFIELNMGYSGYNNGNASEGMPASLKLLGSYGFFRNS